MPYAPGWPPCRRRGGHAGEHSVNQDAENQRLRPSEMVRQHAEQDAANGPADQKNRENDSAIPADDLGSGGSAAGCAQEVVQRRLQDERVDGGVHRIEHPGKPRDEEHQPLIARDSVAPRSHVHKTDL